MFKNQVHLLSTSMLALTMACFNNQSGTEGDFMMEATIETITTDQAMYAPGTLVTVDVKIKNTGSEPIDEGKLLLKGNHLENVIHEEATENFSLDINEERTITVEWSPPKEDFKGYLLEIELQDRDMVLDTNTTAVDVSSSWTKFPRYGYVWDFTKEVDTSERIEVLKNRNINALEYYDWKYKHHMPIPENKEKEYWLDWSGRPIYAESIRHYIQDAKEANMVNMPYNMAYAAVDGYEEDGVNQDWALYFSDENDRGKGHFSFDMSDTASLYFFDMSNEEWQNYIFSRTNEVFEMFDFDGWHSDTVGEWGEMKTSDERHLYVKDTYKQFLNRAKKTMPEDKYLVFNPVGAQGIEQVNASDVDVLYAEIWPWDKDKDGELYDDYYSLKKVIDQSRKESDGKSLVIPAYMSYDYGEENPGAEFNTAAVMLTSVTTYAAGGSRMELGDGDNMLSNEYFPAQHLRMNEELQQRINQLYDFIVAYENLLRDGQQDSHQLIEVIDHKTSAFGEPNAIWTYAKKDDDHEIVQMINLLGVNHSDWRANDGKKATPKIIHDFEMKYYPEEDIESVWLASPDTHDNRSKELAFTRGTDDDGDYVLVEVPSLEYWNMLYMKVK